jgi:hypothetical protein
MLPAPPTAEPTTCFVRDWPVFVHGFFKNDLYPRADVARMVANFAALSDADTALYRREDGSPFLDVNVKIGHDPGQRLKGSLGFLNTGKVVKEQLGPNGTARLWLANVPTAIGAAINAGYLNAGSIECKPEIPNPNDAGKKIPGPVMFAIALLGEEQPAVPGLNAPRAVFADGTPVPPMTDPAPWLLAMFEALKDTAQPDVSGNESATMSLAFSSDYTPARNETIPENSDVTPEAIVAAFQSLAPDQQAAILAQLQAGPGPTPDTIPPVAEPAAALSATPPASPPMPQAQMADMPTAGATPDMMSQFADKCKAYAADPNATPEQKMMSSMFSQFSDMTKRMGDLEAATTIKHKEDEESKMSAFSAEWDATVTKHDGYRKLEPKELKALKDTAIDLVKTKAFSATAERSGLITGIADRLKGLPVNSRLVTPANTGADGKPLPKSPIQPTETINALLGPGSFLAGQVNADAMRKRLNIAG